MNKRPYKSYTKSDKENVLNEIVGERLKVARKNAKLTQSRLAKKLNISFQQIGKYENHPKIYNRPDSCCVLVHGLCTESYKH